jgi:hypothetical protein
MQNVHDKQPVVFQTRWTMNYLAGPMTRIQIPSLNKLSGTSGSSSEESASLHTTSTEKTGVSVPPTGVPENAPVGIASREPTRLPASGSSTRPPVPAGIAEFFLPMNLSFTKAVAGGGDSLPDAVMEGIIYRPGLVASAQIRFSDRRYGLDVRQTRSVLVTTPDKRAVIRWDDYVRSIPEEQAMDPAPDPQSSFVSLDTPLGDARQLNALEKDFSDWVYRTSRIMVRANTVLGVYATPEVSQADFMRACAEAARQARDAELQKATTTIDRQIAALKEKMKREERELQQDQTELGERKREEFVSGAETVFSLLGGKRSRRISEAMSKHRMTEQSKADVEESLDAIAEFKQQFAQLEETRLRILEEGQSRWGEAVNDIREIPILPKKTDIYVPLFGVAWIPYYQVGSGGRKYEIPAFQ